MAKKQKRQVSFTTPTVTAPAKTSAAAVRPGSEFNPDYTYIKKDLKTMGFMIVGFVGLLVVLTFFLR
jgi:hypothetical protein